MPTYRMNVQLNYPGEGGPGLNTWHFRTGSIDDVLSGPAAWIRTFYEGVANLMPNTWSAAFDGSLIEDPYGAPTYATTDAFTVPGTSTIASYVGMASQACVTWRTTSATRSGRGRTFVGPLGFAAIQGDDGTLSPAALTALRAAASALVESSDSFANGAIGVYSRTDGVLRDVVGSSVRDVVAVLRSRRD